MVNGAQLQRFASVIYLGAWLAAACAEAKTEPLSSCQRASDCVAGRQCENQRCQAPDAGRVDASVSDGSAPDACPAPCEDAAESGIRNGGTCSVLATPKYGVLTQPLRSSAGNKAEYECLPGYHLNGEATRRCESSGDWSGKAPTCEPNSCPELQAPEHGSVTLDNGTSTGSKATYTCDATLQLAGATTRTCKDDGSWSGSAPECTCSDHLQTDAMNCGACGTLCSSGTCADGACVRRVFLTGSTLPAMFGSLTQADAACKTLALGAGLTGSYKAWLSDASGSPSTRFSKGAGEYRRIDGMTVAKSFDDLSDGTLLQPINVSESGVAVSTSGNTYVYTGTKPDGSLVTIDSSDPNVAYGATCSNWTLQTDSTWVALGNYTASDLNWSYGGMRQGCSMALRLYCFEQ